jgi:hypothetical protein
MEQNATSFTSLSALSRKQLPKSLRELSVECNKQAVTDLLAPARPKAFEKQPWILGYLAIRRAFTRV